MIAGPGAVNPFAQIGQIGPSTAERTTEAGSVNDAFSAVLTEAMTKTVGRLESAEHLSVGAIQGETDTREVIDAVMSAEQSLQAAIAIRDKVVTAYLEISRMAI